VVFQVEKALDFVFKLGPCKLNNILSAFLEESIRSLARTFAYDEIYNVRGHNLSSMVRSLTDKVQQFGISIHSITITDVLLPQLLQDSLQRTTKYTAMEKCKTMEQVYNSMKLENENTRLMEKSKRENEITAAGEEHKRAIGSVKKEADEVDALVDKRLKEIEAEGKAIVRTKLLEAEKDKATLNGEAYKTMVTLKANGAYEAAMLNVKRDCYVEQRSSDCALTVAKNNASALKIASDAEAKAAKNLRDKRKFTLLAQQTAIMEALSQNKNVVISGSSDYSSFAQIGEMRFGQAPTAAVPALKSK